MLRRVLVFLAVGGVILIACGQADNAEISPDQVTVQLKWLHQAQFAGFYAAEAQGFYDEENLIVTFIPGGVGIDVLRAVVDNGATFGVAGADSIILGRADGLPIVAIATTYRINPFVMVAFTDSGITSPRDFVGRTVSHSPGSGDTTQLYAMLDKAGVDREQVEFVPYTYDITPFLDGEIDVLNSFAAGSLLTLQASLDGRDVNLIWPGDYGVHFYSDTIFTTSNLISENPDLVRRFLRATLRGHRFVIENVTQGVDATMNYAENQDRELQTSMLTASIPLIHTGEDQIGWMRPEIWQGMYELLLEYGYLKGTVGIDTVYSLTFLREIYGSQ